jgi:predicted RNA-binding protein YlxR (DUF448 family)
MAGRHVPERTCVACRTQQPKRAMLRVVRTAPGAVVVDPTGKASGRGAYLCRRAACWEAGLRRDFLARALKTTLSAADRAALEVYAADLAGEGADFAGRRVFEGSKA